LLHELGVLIGGMSYLIAQVCVRAFGTGHSWSPLSETGSDDMAVPFPVFHHYLVHSSLPLMAVIPFVLAWSRCGQVNIALLDHVSVNKSKRQARIYRLQPHPIPFTAGSR
jgi:hypothetical protein